MSPAAFILQEPAPQLHPLSLALDAMPKTLLMPLEWFKGLEILYYTATTDPYMQYLQAVRRVSLLSYMSEIRVSTAKEIEWKSSEQMTSTSEIIVARSENSSSRQPKRLSQDRDLPSICGNLGGNKEGIDLIRDLKQVLNRYCKAVAAEAARNETLEEQQ
ncbi:uncharacterized protein BT62DRAFT_921854 [Guyanagaster necrorhizus]|uniref:Uncharacterized protein n=1 Tax=Guyanagaster necrorhizus TaxID=856835 RepID=A0A9P7VNQ8_9AGAR|nr:uncharacterized protein BT62DRAFT_921854 [Guyanagaster necrorhizus MCA 3950]KAG7443700.1 hypothetical protein BT62DRAFT_921854 [Guyanagaster necrorhizus MCA 3950]